MLVGAIAFVILISYAIELWRVHRSAAYVALVVSISQSNFSSRLV